LREYFIKGKAHSRTRQYVYINSIGGTEVALLPFNEDVQMEYERTQASVYRDNGVGNGSYNPLAPSQRINLKTFESRGRTVDTGKLSFVQTQNLRQMMLSQHVYEVWAYFIHPSFLLRYIPQSVTNKKAVMVSSKTSVFGHTFEFKDNFDNEVFTPMAINNCAVFPLYTGLPKPVQGECAFMMADGSGAMPFITVNSNIIKHMSYKPNFASGDTSATSLNNPITEEGPQLWEMTYYYNEQVTQLVFSHWERLRKFIGKLPLHIRRLEAEDGLLTELPKLPYLLSYLYCGNNAIKKLPALPLNLYYLYANDNDIEDISEVNAAEAISTALIQVDLSNNKIPVAQIEAFMQRVVDNAIAWDPGDGATMDFSGQTPAAPLTVGGLALKNTLETTYNWTVTVDV
jgi:hypothetical protein